MVNLGETTTAYKRLGTTVPTGPLIWSERQLTLNSKHFTFQCKEKTTFERSKHFCRLLRARRAMSACRGSGAVVVLQGGLEFQEETEVLVACLLVCLFGLNSAV